MGGAGGGRPFEGTAYSRVAGSSGTVGSGTASLECLPQRPEQPVLSKGAVGRGSVAKKHSTLRTCIFLIQNGTGIEAKFAFLLLGAE